MSSLAVIYIIVSFILAHLQVALRMRKINNPWQKTLPWIEKTCELPFSRASAKTATGE